MVYRIKSVLSWFVIILKFDIFLVPLRVVEKNGCDWMPRCFFFIFYCLNFETNMFRMPGLRPSGTSSFKAHSLSIFFLIFTIGWRLFSQCLGRRNYIDTFLPALLRSALAAHSLWTIISSDFCETVVFQLLCVVVVCRVMLCVVVVYHVMLCVVVVCRVMICVVVVCHVMLCVVVVCRVMMCCGCLSCNVMCCGCLSCNDMCCGCLSCNDMCSWP